MREAASIDRLTVITRMTTIVTLVSVILGVAIGVQQLSSAVSSAAETLSGLKLQALAQMRDIIDRDARIHQRIAEYVVFGLDADVAYVRGQIELGHSGEELFYSSELTNYREICGHYQILGAIVELGYLPFDLVFEVVTFPDQFWRSSHQLRSMIGENWHAPGMPLSDFQRTVGSLSQRYQALRAERGYRHEDV
jgi:hypothetical protein